MPIVAGPRTNTVEVGTLPDAVRPQPESRPRALPLGLGLGLGLAPAPAPPPATPAVREPDAAPIAAPSRPPRSAPREPRATPARPAPSAAAPERGATAAVPSGATTSQEAGSFGALGLPPGTQYFARAFARALPVVLGDVAWLSQPLGPAGEASLDVAIDESGRIADVKLDPRLPPPALLARAVERVFVLLKSGTFSLDGSRVQAGLERLSLSVEVAQAVPNPDASADPKLMNEKGHRAPTRDRPGSAHLTFNSGRRVEVVIRMRAD